MRKAVGILAVTVVAILGANATASSKFEPAVSGTWQLSCLSAYQDIVSTMNPAWIPDQLKNGFETLAVAGEIGTGEVRLGGSPTVPWLTIYNKDLKPIYHAVGFNSRSDALWQLVIDQNKPTAFAPKLYEIEPYTGVRAADFPEADFTFVEYFADWCTNCKLVQGAMADFIAAHPKLKITHVQIEADTAKMQKKKYTSKACPVTT
ncbi:MAG: thioredoxin domain-containing protein [Robiginitomaculum sp.]|nr:thioredoxin domain-containing protein [Robiginitomaculum sp.]